MQTVLKLTDFVIRIAISPLVLFTGVLTHTQVIHGLDSVPEPSEYRLDHYDAPVPKTLSGATVLQPDQVKSLLETRLVIPIDVVPAQRKPLDLDSNVLWIPPPHFGIPGSVWLPDVGRGRLNSDLEQYFQRALEEVTDKRTSKGLMFYCRPDCWMSWNAAKRALEYGYENVYWFPEGVSGWTMFEDDVEKLLPYIVGQ